MTDTLPSWNDSEAKRRLVGTVRAMVDEKSDALVHSEIRIASFGDGGTLWCEEPVYIQASLLLERWREMVQQDPRSRESQPYRAAAEGDVAYFAGLSAHIEGGVSEAYLNITPEEFDEAARLWFASALHPCFGVPYTRLTDRPMIELRRND